MYLNKNGNVYDVTRGYWKRKIVSVEKADLENIKVQSNKRCNTNEEC